jgi:microcystin-dependent protein
VPDPIPYGLKSGGRKGEGMTDTASGDERAVLRDKKSGVATFRRGFSGGLALGLIPLLFFLIFRGEVIYGQSGGDALFVHSSGRVGIGTNSPRAQLDVQDGLRTGSHPNSIKALYVTGDFGEASGVEFRHNNGSQGIGFGYNTIYATGVNASQDLNLAPKGTGKVRVKGDLEITGKVTGDGALVKGLIMMWHGEVKDIPKGWALCDGTRSTPDLKGRFIVGYDPQDPDYNAPRKTGGEKRHTLTIDEMPSHAHKGTTDSSRLSLRWTGGIGGTHGLAAAANQGAANFDHQHKVSTENVGGDKPHENRPPYYVLAYIMFTGE